jgi:hypothetical protein
MPGRTEENHENLKSIAGLRAEIWIWNLQNTKKGDSRIKYWPRDHGRTVNDQLGYMCEEAVAICFKVLSKTLPSETEETHRNFYQDSWNTGPLKYEGGLLTTKLQHLAQAKN